jgi:hypothetical protein
MKPIATIIIFSIMLFHFNKVFSKQLPSNSNFEKNKIMHFDDLFLNADSFIAPKYKLMVNGFVIQPNIFFKTTNVQFGNISFEELIANPLEVEIRGDIYFVKLAKK